ncbi:MAG TPA: MarR family transcriptional regulator [Micromonosporaceae bacterium]|nr:MarR family transcriptional regulator [Micromonosporaceae bacterium]
MSEETVRNDTEVGAFIERFASVLAETGWQRMAARVFAALLVTDSGRRTAAELSDILNASPAAISGAVRYLEQISLASRERDPGTRRDVYRIDNDMWFRVALSQDRVLGRYISSLSSGITAVGPQTPAGERLVETRDFFSFLAAEMPRLMERWQATHAAPAAR